MIHVGGCIVAPPSVMRAPVRLMDVVAVAANDVQVPWPLALNSTLAAATTAVQALIDVETPLGHVKPVSNFFLAIAPSGSRKSAVDKLLSKPIREFQDRLYRRFQTEDEPAFVQALELWQVKATRLKRKVIDIRLSAAEVEVAEAELAAHLAAKPLRPREPQFLYRDFTVPALMEGLANKRRHASVSSSDASSVLHGQGFRQLADFNLLWDGDAHVVNRAGKGSLQIMDVRLTIDLAVQMEAFRDYFYKGDKARSTGFAARCLTCMPESLMGSRFTSLNAPCVNHSLIDFYGRVDELLTLTEARMGIDGRIQRDRVKFSESAASEWLHWINNEIEPSLRDGGEYRSVSDQASKIGEIACRLAAVFAYFEYGEKVVTVTGFRLVKELCMKYLYDYKLIVEGKIERATQDQKKSLLAQWLYQKFQSMVDLNLQRSLNLAVFVEKSYIRTYGPNPLRDKQVLSVALDVLMREGIILVEQQETRLPFHQNGGRLNSRTIVRPGPQMQFKSPIGGFFIR